MSDSKQQDWKALCNAAIAARDPDRLLQIIEQLNAVMDREQTARRNLLKDGITHERKDNVGFVRLDDQS
jgi:hypothetical protein